MKKILLFSALAGTMVFYACKKDGTTTTITNNVHDTTTLTVFASGKVNGETLSNGINVGYGTRVSDSVLPAASTDASAPVLDPTYNKQYSVVKSRYLTIYPPNVSGNVAGYYVQIVGAKTYFKIDYTQAKGVRKAAKQARVAKNNGAARGDGDGFIDSSIVLKLPATFNGDTFYVKYAAFDTANRVSNAITAFVKVLPEGTDSFTDSLSGSWLYSSYRDYTNGTYNSDWQIDTGNASYQYYTCNNGLLSAADAETDIYLPYSAYSYTWMYTFAKYGMIESYSNTGKYLDTEASTCSNYVYGINYNYSGQTAGGISYDRVSKKITFIYENSGSNINLNYDTYNLSALTDSDPS